MGTGRKAANLTYDKERTIAIMRHLEKVWEQEGNGQTGLPGHTPPELELVHALKLSDPLAQTMVLLTFARLSLSGISAKQLMGNVYYLALQNMELLYPKDGVLVVDPKSEQGKAFRRHLPLNSMRPELPGWWAKGLNILEEKYQGDPRQIFWQIGPHRKQLMKALQEFPGIGQKIAQMTIGFFYKWAEENDRPLFEEVMSKVEPCFAVDIHWLRLLFQLGIITGFDSTDRDKVSETASDFLSETALEGKIVNWWAVGQKMWQVGQRDCTKHRRTKDAFSARKHCELACAAIQFCRGLVPANTKYINGFGDERSATSRGVVPWEVMGDHTDHKHLKLDF